MISKLFSIALFALGTHAAIHAVPLIAVSVFMEGAALQFSDCLQVRGLLSLNGGGDNGAVSLFLSPQTPPFRTALTAPLFLRASPRESTGPATLSSSGPSR